MTGRFRVDSCRPLALRVMNVGPFQDAVKEVDFTDSNGDPCNYYLFVSRNGRGKTTLLEVMAWLFQLLDDDWGLTSELRSPHAVGGWNREDYPDARLQLDLRLQLWLGDHPEVVVLSLVDGEGELPTIRSWDQARLESVGATDWIQVGGRQRRGARSIRGRSKLFEETVAFIQRGRGRTDSQFWEPTDLAPRMLYFPASRDILPPPDTTERRISKPQRLAHPETVLRFGAEGADWSTSPDGFLVWLAWVFREEGPYARALEVINDHVFHGTRKFLKGVRRDPPEAIVELDDRPHRLDQLSSGERNLVQLFLRIGGYMTRNTIILIDEQDLHLHPRWRNRLVRHLKELLTANEGLTIISTSHSVETLRSFAFGLEEPGLRKGGYIFEEDVSDDA